MDKAINAHFVVEAMPWHDFRGTPGEDREKGYRAKRAQAAYEAVEDLRRLYPGGWMGHLAASLYFDPIGWRGGDRKHNTHESTKAYLLWACIERDPPATVHAHLENRLAYLFASLGRVREVEGTDADRYPHEGFFAPSIPECLEILLATPPGPQGLTTMAWVVGATRDFMHRGRGCDRSTNCAQWLVSNVMERYVHRVMSYLYLNGWLPYEAFRTVMVHEPWGLNELTKDAEDGKSPWVLAKADPSYIATAKGYAQRLAVEASRGALSNWPAVINAVHVCRGSEMLLAALRGAEEAGIERLEEDPRGPERRGFLAIWKMASARGPEPQELGARQALLAQVCQFSPRALEAVLPVALHWRHLLLEALGWAAAGPLVDQIAASLPLDEHGDLERMPQTQVGNPLYGQIEVEATRAALAQAGPDLSRKVLRIYEESDLGARDATMWIKALAGYNAAEVASRFGKRSNTAVRAYGLLPLADTPDALLQRYDAIKAFEEGSKDFGPQRKLSERAAARAAFANLARVAGFEDEVRLTWAVAARREGAIGEAEAARRWAAGKYEIRLDLSPPQPRLRFLSGEREFRAPPAAVRGDPVFAEAKAALQRAKEAIDEVCDSLEQAMVSARPLTLDDVRNVGRIEAAHEVLATTIFRDEGGFYGTLDPGSLELVGINERRPVNGSLLVAHPYHLEQDGALGAWQAEVVRRRVVQPYKQAFRELYTVTPVEAEAPLESARFEGHRVVPQIAFRLFESRGWRCYEGIGWTEKVFPAQRVVANFPFPDSPRPFDVGSEATSGRVQFRKAGQAGREERIPLRDVPPTVFSEAMRDADLVVSVAQEAGPQGQAYRAKEGRQLAQARGEAGEPYASDEYIARRREALRLLLKELGVERVAVEDRFAEVEGKLGQYRVHLSSGAVFLMPGGHVCIVPAPVPRRPLYLPFEDEKDRKMSEVLSKVIMLANDDEITDASILAQLRRR